MVDGKGDLTEMDLEAVVGRERAGHALGGRLLGEAVVYGDLLLVALVRVPRVLRRLAGEMATSSLA